MDFNQSQELEQQLKRNSSSTVTLKVSESKVTLPTHQAELIKYLQRTIERQHLDNLIKSKEEKTDKDLVKINIRKRPI